ncbi:MAG TPA: hypothetical protein VMR02_11720, partial [Terracidiphilus sp.]|nr:hypothetical protein [Terracidiphilus sp.]
MAEPSTKSEMARSSECTDQYAQKVIDSAGIVRDAIFLMAGYGDTRPAIWWMERTTTTDFTRRPWDSPS